MFTLSTTLLTRFLFLCSALLGFGPLDPLDLPEDLLGFKEFPLSKFGPLSLGARL